MAQHKKKKPSLKKYLVTIIISFVAVAFIGSFAYNYSAKRGQPTAIAVVNGEPITVGPDSLFANLYRQFHEQQRQKNEGEALTEEENLDLLQKALDAAIQRTLILQYAEKQGITVSRQTVLSSIVKKGYYATAEKSFSEERYLETPETDRQEIFKREKQQLTVNLFLDEYVNTTRVSEPELKSFHQFTTYGKKIAYVFLRYDNIPPEKLKEFYNENPKLFQRAHVAHILVKDQQKAQQILEKVKKDPEKFDEIAKQESADPSSEKGGDLGWVHREDMTPEFSEAAFSLKQGEISSVVKTVFGYHIIKALEPVGVQPYKNAVNRARQKYVEAYREEMEKKVAMQGKEFLTRASRNPENFKEIASKQDLRVITTDYITASGRYILNEAGNIPLFELMGNDKIIKSVFSTQAGNIGGPVKTSEGEIIFKVIDEKEFERQKFEDSKQYLTNVYSSLKQNYLFNDWYTHARKNSKIVNNFNQFYKKQG